MGGFGNRHWNIKFSLKKKGQRCLEACRGRHLTTEGDTLLRPQFLATPGEAEEIEAAAAAVAALPIPILTPGPFYLFKHCFQCCYLCLCWKGCL